MSNFDFTFNGKTITEATHEPGYVAEFQRALRELVPRPPQAVLEWGSGTSSLILLEQCAIWNFNLFVTIDDSAAYQQAVFAGRNLPPFLRMEVRSVVGALGQEAAEANYSSFPLTLNRKFDLVFIDGRRRVECAYTAALMAHEDTIVILHDYRRARYRSVLWLYDVVADGRQFRVMRPRPGVLRALNERS